jgi:hypothetical protein
MIGAPHPNIWKLIELLQEQETVSSLKKIRLDNDLLRTRGRHRRDIQMDLNIEKLKVAFLRNELSLLTYVDKLAHLVHEYD